MIYSINESKSIVDRIALFGEEADNFLESVEVALYEDTVAIGENVYDGAEAEEFLAENGIHLYEDHIVLEGKQAEEYKARKEKEKKDKDDKENERLKNRYDYDGNWFSPPGVKERRDENGNRVPNNRDAKTKRTTLSAKDYERDKKAMKVLKDEVDRRGGVEFNKFTYATDATNRHIRRHPKQYKESTIFDFDLK